MSSSKLTGHRPNHSIWYLVFSLVLATLTGCVADPTIGELVNQPELTEAHTAGLATETPSKVLAPTPSPEPSNTPVSSSSPVKKTAAFEMQDGPDNLRQLFEELQQANLGGDTELASQLTLGLIPDEDCLGQAFRQDVSESAFGTVLDYYADLFPQTTDADAWARLLVTGPDRSQVNVHAATTEELVAYQEGSVAFNEFPGGARQLAQTVFAPGLTWYEVEYVEPGESAGMKYHLFFWTGSRWCMLGPIWRTSAPQSAVPTPSRQTETVPDSISETPLRFAGHTRAVWSVTFSPDGNRLATGSDDATARIWDSTDGRELLRLTGHGDTVNEATFSPDGQWIVTASDDSSARLWDAYTGEELAKFIGHQGFVLAAIFEPSGDAVLTAGSDGTIRMWDIKTGRAIRQFDGHTDFIWSLAFSPDAQHFVSASSDGTARLWEVDTGAELVQMPLGYGDAIFQAAFSPDGTQIISVGEDEIFKVWSAHTGEELHRPVARGRVVFSTAYNPQGGTVVTAGDDGIAQLWDTTTWQVVRQLPGSTVWVLSVAFSPDGTSIAAADRNGSVLLWRIGEKLSFSPQSDQSPERATEVDSVPPADIDKFTEYSNPAQNLTFIYPTNWRIQYEKGNVFSVSNRDGLNSLNDIAEYQAHDAVWRLVVLPLQGPPEQEAVNLLNHILADDRYGAVEVITQPVVTTQGGQIKATAVYSVKKKSGRQFVREGTVIAVEDVLIVARGNGLLEDKDTLLPIFRQMSQNIVYRSP